MWGVAAAIFSRRGSNVEMKRALALARQSFDIRLEILPPNHPDLAESYAGFGIYYFETGDTEKAETFLRKALTIMDHDSPDAADAYSMLGLTLVQQGRFDEAEEAIRQGLQISEDLGDVHLAAKMHHSLGFLFRSKGDYEEALSHFAISLNSRESLLAPDHPALAFDLNAMAITYEKMGDLDSARVFAGRSLAIREKHYGPESTATGRTRLSLASLHARAGEFGEAMSLFRHTWRLASESDRRFPDRFSRFIAFAALMKESGQHRDAAEVYTVLLPELEKDPNTTLAQVASALTDFADLSRRMGQEQRAVELEARAETLLDETTSP